MKTFIKVVIVLVVIVVIAAISIQFIVNRPFVKDKVKQSIAKSINRPISIGNLRVNILTGGSLSLNDFYIYEKDGQTVFAGLKSLDIGIKILPLLGKKVVISGISVNKPEVSIIKYKTDTYNFSDITQQSNTADKTTQDNSSAPGTLPEKTAQPEKETSKSSSLSIGYLIITDASLEIKQEEQDGTFSDFSFTGLNLKINNFSLDKPVDISLSSNIGSSGSVNCVISTSSINDILYSLDSADFDMKLNMENINTSELSGFLPAGSLDSINFSELSATSSIKGSIQNGLNIDSEVTTAPAKDKESLVLDKASFKCFVEKIKNIDPDQSKYLETINIKGSIDANSITYQNNTLSKIHTTILSDKGNVSLTDISAVYCQGTIKGSVSLDTAQDPVPFKTDMNITGMQLKDMLTTNFGYDRLTGTANADVSLQGKGFDNDSINTNLTGSADLSIRNGVLKGKSLREEILNAMQNPLLAQAFTGLQGQRSALKKKKTRETKIDSMDIKAIIENGICNINTLSAETGSADLNGNGTIKFDQTTNLKVQLLLSKELTQLLLGAGEKGEKELPNYLPQEKGRLMLPATITGLISNPTVTPDFSIIIASLTKGALQDSLTNSLGGGKKDKKSGPLGNILGGGNSGSKGEKQSSPIGNIFGGGSGKSDSGSGTKSKGMMDLF